MNNIIKRLFAILAVILLLASSLSITVSAGDTIHNMVNIADSNKNMYGSGYTWNNRTKVLTLNNVNIDTDDAHGMRLPRNCTVVLKGNNYIKASKYAISCLGTIVFKGNGTLTLDAGEIGFYLISQDNTHKVRLLGGSYVINAGKYGVYSDASDFSFIGDKMQINVPDGSYAICGRIVNILGGNFSANATVAATHILTVDGANVNVDSFSVAFEAKTLKLKDLSITEYNGEASVRIVSTANNLGQSVIFGESVPEFVDYILLAILSLGVIAGISLPALYRKKKERGPLQAS